MFTKKKPGAKKTIVKKMVARKPAKKFLFKAPAGTRPFFLHIRCMTGKDGLLTNVDAIQFKGRPDNPKAKKVLMSKYDPKTLVAIATRLGGTSFVTTPTKRLPPNTKFLIESRVAVSAQGVIRFAFRGAKMKTETRTKTLNKKDEIYRRLRRCVRFMPAAFTKVKPFPSIQELKEMSSDE